MKGCKAGNPAAQRHLYDLYSGKMLAVCHRYTGNRADAEDVMQDGWIRVFSKIGSYRSKGELEGWIRRVMVNVALRHFQNRKKVVGHTGIEKAEVMAGDSPNLDSFSYDELMNMVGQLPDGYRMVFNLYAIEGYKHEEIAKMIGCTVGTSKSQLSRARGQLKAMVIHHEQEAKEVNNE